MVRRGSQAIDHAFDLKAQPPKFKQHAETQAGRPEMIGALHPMRL
jgi:hypothetical protein